MADDDRLPARSRTRHVEAIFAQFRAANLMAIKRRHAAMALEAAAEDRSPRS